MRSLSNILFLLSTLITLFFAWKWYSTLDPHYEPAIVIISGISAIVTLWLKSIKSKAPKGNSLFFLGNKNKISQTNQTKDKENSANFLGSSNEVNQE